MKLSEIKNQLNVSSLALNKTEDPEWVSFFDNETRTSVLMPTEVADALLENRDLDLALVPKGKRVSKKSKSEYSLFLILVEKADYIL